MSYDDELYQVLSAHVLDDMAREAGDATTDSRGRVIYEFDIYGLARFAALVAERNMPSKDAEIAKMAAQPPQIPAAWAMEIPGCDGSADWVELGAEQPEPFPPAVASPLYRAPPARRRDGRRGAA